MQAIDEITAVIGRINDIQNTIASAVEEQTGTTNEISRNISETAKGSSDIASNITGVANAATETQHSANASQKAADELSKLAVKLGGVVSQFKLADNGRHLTGVSGARPRVNQRFRIKANIRRSSIMTRLHSATSKVHCGFYRGNLSGRCWYSNCSPQRQASTSPKRSNRAEKTSCVL